MSLASTTARGPAIILWNGLTLYFKDGIDIKPTRTDTKIETDNFGEFGRKFADAKHTITGTPVGEHEGFAELYPHGSGGFVAGTSLSSDTTLTVHWANGRKRVYQNAILTGLPDFIGSTRKTMFGALEFTCIKKSDLEFSNANAIFTDSAEAYPGDAGFDQTAIVQHCYAMEIDYSGRVGGELLMQDTVEGLTLSFQLDTEELVADCGGVYDVVLNGRGVTASFDPLGFSTEEFIEEFQTTQGVEVGADLLSASLLFTGGSIPTGDLVDWSLPNTSMTEATLAAGRTTKHVGAVTFEGTETLVAGALQPLWSVSTS